MGFLAIWNTFHAHQQQLISPKSSEAIPVLIGKSVWIPTSYEAITATVDFKKIDCAFANLKRGRSFLLCRT